MCGYEDSVQNSTASTPDAKLALFQSHIDRWYSLDWTETRIRVPHARLYDFVAGVYCTASLNALTVVQLPSRVRSVETKTWTHNGFEFAIADFTFDPSQDLLVLAEQSVLCLLERSQSGLGGLNSRFGADTWTLLGA